MTNQQSPTAPTPETVREEVIEMFEDDLLLKESFEISPQTVADEVEASVEAYNSDVKRAAELAREIFGVHTAGFIDAAESLRDGSEPSEELDEKKEELYAEFQDIAHEDSTAVHTAEEVLDTVGTVYARSTLGADDGDVSYAEIHRDLRDPSPELAAVLGGVLEVLARAEQLKTFSPSPSSALGENPARGS